MTLENNVPGVLYKANDIKKVELFRDGLSKASQA